MNILIYFLIWILSLYQLLLMMRVVLDVAQIVSRNWEPTGLILVGANFVYRCTDPPLRLLGKYIPPVRFGGIAFDIGFLALFIGISILQRILGLILFV